MAKREQSKNNGRKYQASAARRSKRGALKKRAWRRKCENVSETRNITA